MAFADLHNPRILADIFDFLIIPSVQAGFAETRILFYLCNKIFKNEKNEKMTKIKMNKLGQVKVKQACLVKMVRGQTAVKCMFT